MLRIFIFMLFIATICMPFSTKAYAQCLRFALGSGSAYMPAYAHVLSNILSQDGICNSVKLYPSKRATTELLNGRVDGEFGRIQFYGQNFPGRLVRVDPAFFHYEGWLITRNPAINSLDQVTGPLGVVRGWKWMQQVAQQLNIRKIEKTSSIENLVKMFHAGRVEQILISDVNLKLLGLEHQNFPRFKTIDLNLHIWLDKTKTSYRKPIGKALTDFFASGKTLWSEAPKYHKKTPES